MLSPLICILFMPLKSDDKTFLLFQNHTKLHIFHLNAPIFSLSQQFALNALSPPVHCCAMRPITLVGILQDCGVKTRRRIATRSWPVPGKTPDTEGQGLGSVQHLGSEGRAQGQSGLRGGWGEKDLQAGGLPRHSHFHPHRKAPGPSTGRNLLTIQMPHPQYCRSLINPLWSLIF